jgi:hypothetical protein
MTSDLDTTPTPAATRRSPRRRGRRDVGHDRAPPGAAVPTTPVNPGDHAPPPPPRRRQARDPRSRVRGDVRCRDRRRARAGPRRERRSGGLSSASHTPGNELALVDEAWNKLHQNYVDAANLDDQKLAYAAIDGMTEAVGDTGHTEFMTPEERAARRSSLSGSYAGIGAEVDTSPEACR